MYLLTRESQRELQSEKTSASSLSEVLLHAGAVELLPLPIAAPIGVERLLGGRKLLLSALDLVEDGGVARAGASQFCEKG